MAKLEKTLEEEYLGYMDYLENFENHFERNIKEFLLSESEKCLVLETKDTRTGLSRIIDIVLQLESEMNWKYRGEENQLFLTWTDLTTIVTTSKLLPKFSNLVVIELPEEDPEHESSALMGKIVDRLNVAMWRKVIFVTCQAGLLDISLQRMTAGTFLKINEFEDKISATVDIPGEDPLLKAAASGNVRLVAELLKTCVDTSEPDYRTEDLALHLAVERGHKDVVLLLIQNGASVNASQSEEFPLEVAARRGYEDVVTTLAENGATVDQPIKFRSTALIQAAQQGFYNILITLIEYGADINIQDGMGCSALHLASENGHYFTVYTLLKHGADVDCQDNSKFTPLHYASLNGHVDIVNQLLGMGARIDPHTSEGATPLDLARENGHDDIVQQLNDRLDERNVLRQAIDLIRRKSTTNIMNRSSQLCKGE